MSSSLSLPPQQPLQPSIVSATTTTGEAYFGEEEDEMLSLTSKLHEQEFQPLSWRGDPQVNHSDWTIVLTNLETCDSRNYHVHKNILGVGPRQCRYFATLFATIANVVEKQESTSRIDLAGPYANAFPIMLDFCYSLTDLNDSQPLQDLAPLAVVALRHLACYFDCAALMRKTNDFVRKDLSVATGPQYLMAAAKYGDDRLEGAARNLCAEQFSVLMRKQVLELPVEQYRSLVSSPLLQCDSKYLASITVAFIQQHIDVLSVDLLSELTDECKMPQIGKIDAPIFLDLIRRLNVTSRDEWNKIRSLCLRCSKALVKKKEWLSWDVQAKEGQPAQQHCCSLTTTTTANETDDKSTATTFTGSSSSSNSALIQPEAEILVSRLLASLIEARRDYYDETSRLKAQVESLSVKLADTTTTKDKLLMANKGFQSKTAALKKHIENLNEKISFYRRRVKDQKSKNWGDSL